jgi:hypothetical protein
MEKRAIRVLIFLLSTFPCASFIPQHHRRIVGVPSFPTSSSGTHRRVGFVASTTGNVNTSSTTTTSSFRPTTFLLAENTFDGNESAGRKNDEADSSTGDIMLKKDDDSSPAAVVTNTLLPKAYWVAQYIFAATSLLIFATPDRSFRMMLRQKWSGGAGYACAAALCGIFQTAHVQGRQFSDTYKRLHIAVAMFSLMSLTAVPGEAGFFPLAQQGPMIFLLSGARIIGALVALWGWKASIQKHVVPELTGGIVDTLQGLRVRDRKKALTYRNTFLLVLGAALSSFFQGRFLRSYQEDFLKTNFQISLQWSAVARLSMIAVMIYSLKDAAERDRLGGTTFIQLNVLVGMVAFTVGFGQAVYPVATAARRGALFFVCSVAFFVKAYQGQTTKKLKQQY